MSGPISILDETYRVAWGDLVYMKENLPEVLITGLIGPLLYLLAFGYGIGGLTLTFGKVTITSVACALILGILANLLLKNAPEEDEEK